MGFKTTTWGFEIGAAVTRDEPTEEQITKFRSILNRSLTFLAPHATPEDTLNLSEDQLRLIAGTLGTEGTAHQVKYYVLLEREKWKNHPPRRTFLDQLIAVVMREIDLFEFYIEPKGPREFPLPSHVAVLNANTGKSDKTIPMDEFIERLRAVSASSVFKK